MEGGPTRTISVWTTVRCIVTKEVRDLLRDRRAVFFAFVLPLLTYPVFFLLVSVLKENQREDLVTRELRVGIVGGEERLSNLLADERLVLTRGATDSDAVRDGRVDLFLRMNEETGPGEDGSLRAWLAKIAYLATSPASEEARRRITRVLEEYRNELLLERLGGLGLEVQPTTLVQAVTADLASDEQLSGASLGRILPILLVMLLLTGGSFAALDLVAGEKERGTLETLFVHPVSTDTIVWGKLIVIFAASLVSVVLNLAGVYLSLLLAQYLNVQPPGFGSAALEVPPALTLGVVLLLSLPLAALSSAVLLSVSAYARSFREAQTYLLPVTVLGFVAVLPAVSPLITLESAVLVVPVAGVALAMREVLGGEFPWPALAAVFLSTSVYAVVLLWRASALLKNEKVVLGLESPPLGSDATGEGRERRGLLFGSLMLLLVYFAGSALQAWDLYIGLALTLWGVILVPTLLYPRWVRLPARELLGLRRTRWVNYVYGFLIAVSSVLLISAYMRVQSEYLPFPSAMEEFFRELLGKDDLTPVLRLLLFAVSPAICEELLWRGAFQGEVGVRGRTLATVTVVGVFFGFFHLSIYRAIPTGVLGAVLALVRIRSGSIFPCILVHAVYNGVAVQYIDRLVEDEDLAAVLLGPGVLAIAGAVLVGSLWGLRSRQESAERRTPSSGH